jgi:hypothetical protein
VKIPKDAWEAFLLFAVHRLNGGKEVSVKSTTPDGPKIFAPFPKNTLDEQIGDVAAWECAFIYSMDKAIAGGYLTQDEIETCLKTASDVVKHDDKCQQYNCGQILDPPRLKPETMQSEAECMRNAELCGKLFVETGVISQ